MTDGLPTDEQLRRIQRGVRERIDRRRRVARGIAGTTAGVLLLAGGFAVLPRLGTSGASGGSAGTSGGSTAGGSAAGGSAASTVEVRCEPGERPVRTADDPERIAAACGAVAVDFQSGTGRMPLPTPADRSPSSARRVVICRAADGVLDVLPAGARPREACAAAGLRPY